MKTKFFGIFATISLFAVSSCSDSTPDEPAIPEGGEVVYDDIQTSCDCQPTWFSGSEILPPAEGPDSPFGAATTTNCLFHQWSWQKFLYLTQAETPGGLPFFLTSMDQVDSEMDPVTQPNGVIVLTENTQAGGAGILTTNPTYGSGSETVYYSIHISEEFKTAADGFQKMILDNPDSVSNVQTFPVGSVELKVSWVNTSTIASDQLANYFTTKADIGGTTITVAMLGMHVVGVVENHPEFIWATFEHNDLAPHYDWAATTSTDVPVTSPQNMALFAANANAVLADIKWKGTIKNPNNVFSIYKYGTPQIPGGGFMTGTSQNTGEDNFNNIAELNKSVHDTLKHKGLTLWTNYFYDGSIWMNTDGMSKSEQITQMLDRVNDFGDINSPGPLRGSLAAANISMETYEQTNSKSSIHAMTPDSVLNCLVCHGPSSYLPISGVTNATSPTYISHIFMNHMNSIDATLTEAELRKKRYYLFNLSRKSN